MRRQTFSSAIGKTVQYRNLMSLETRWEALVWPCSINTNSYSSLHMLDPLKHNLHTPIKLTCNGSTLTFCSRENLWFQYKVAAQHPTHTLFTHISHGHKCEGPSVSAVSHVWGFKLSCVFNFPKESYIKLAVTIHYNKGFYIGGYPEKRHRYCTLWKKGAG